MKTLYIECNMGAAGDMLTAAFLELVADKEKTVNKLNAMGIPGVKFSADKMVKCGVTGTHMSVTVNGVEEEVVDVNEENCHSPHSHVHDHSHEHGHDHNHHHDHEHSHDHDHSHNHEHHHEHDHDHSHGHDHSHEHHHHDHSHDHGHSHDHAHHGMSDIRSIIGGLNISDKAKSDAIKIYEIIAEAEGYVHGAPVDQIHFHEVGNMDAIADVTAVAVIMEELGASNIIVSPINTGKGQVKCAHGIIPVPAPATARILQDVPSYNNWVQGELCTPTGAAILKYYADDFGSMPAMKVNSIGYGMGAKDFEAVNCVRTFLGESADEVDNIIELNFNVDDMTGEEIGFAMEMLLKMGAREVFATPVFMKKTRPGHLITLLCDVDNKQRMVENIFKYTTTIGIREAEHPRYILNRTIETVETEFGSIRKKVSSGYGVSRYKYEYDDLSEIAKANDITIDEVRKSIEKNQD